MRMVSFYAPWVGGHGLWRFPQLTGYLILLAQGFSLAPLLIPVSHVLLRSAKRVSQFTKLISNWLCDEFSAIAFDFKLLDHARFLLLTANLSMEMAWRAIMALWTRPFPHDVSEQFGNASRQFLRMHHHLDHGHLEMPAAIEILTGSRCPACNPLDCNFDGPLIRVWCYFTQYTICSFVGRVYIWNHAQTLYQPLPTDCRWILFCISQEDGRNDWFLVTPGWCLFC